MSGPLPRVALIGTGGTVSSLGRHSLDIYEYADYPNMLTATEVVSGVSELSSVAEVIPIDFLTAPSTAIQASDWLALRELIATTVTEHQVDGVVLTHGTATIEETAYFLNLTLSVEVPVVLVGAQRPYNALSTDSHMNLLSAVRVAGSPAARGKGVLVVVNDEIHAAREVTKSSTYRLQTFVSRDAGPLGVADPDRVVFYREPTRAHYPERVIDLAAGVELPRVDVAYSYAGSDGAAVDAFVAAGARGIVFASLAPGKLTPGEDDAQLRAQAAGVIAIRSCRGGSSRVIDRPRLVREGVVAADNLNPQKARVLAILAIHSTTEPAEIQQLFDEF